MAPPATILCCNCRMTIINDLQKFLKLCGVYENIISKQNDRAISLLRLLKMLFSKHLTNDILETFPFKISVYVLLLTLDLLNNYVAVMIDILLDFTVLINLLHIY